MKDRWGGEGGGGLSNSYEYKELPKNICNWITLMPCYRNCILCIGVPSVFFSSATISAGLLASFWDMPMFSPASTDPELSDKSKYSTLVRTSPAFSKMGAAILEIFTHFNWTTTLIISQRPEGIQTVFCDYASRSIQESFYTKGKPQPELHQFDRGISNEDIDLILHKVKHRARSELILYPICAPRNNGMCSLTHCDSYICIGT